MGLGTNLLFCFTREETIVIEVWVTDSNSGGMKSLYAWTKHLTIGPLVGIFRPIVFWNEDQLIMETARHEIVSYNLSTKKNSVIITEK